ncbi:helix-turn-helix transcriptional regulator [Embleya scabrispora]|uniref:helix-turn-helix transcriptional regulator n=1 Tax=Embleya scabrispora TaxID=159449 RepID=UPI000382B797|nr:helix-turn-helix domain-containing protein [Embleya scabrispora]MYS86826.1 helix-turn-helix domain-containing protein [Streptomyces sp. SID5474]
MTRKTKIPDIELLTVPEVLEALGGLSRRTFYRWRELGLAPACHKLPNGELRITRKAFAEWLDTRAEEAA